MLFLSSKNAASATPFKLDRVGPNSGSQFFKPPIKKAICSLELHVKPHVDIPSLWSLPSNRRGFDGLAKKLRDSAPRVPEAWDVKQQESDLSLEERAIQILIFPLEHFYLKGVFI